MWNSKRIICGEAESIFKVRNLTVIAIVRFFALSNMHMEWCKMK